MRALWLIVLCLLPLFSCAQTPPRVLQLLARSSDEVTDPGLSQAQWRWLREHRKLRFALWQPMLPPYDITTGLNDYGGINADFVGLLAQNLGVEVDVIQYPSYADTLAALKAAEVDFIAEAGDNQLHQGLILSKPYSQNVAVEVVNGDNVSPEEVRTIAVYPTYDREKVMARYPNARLVSFASARHAMEALAFHNIDLFFCDAVTARYLVSQSNLSNLRIRTISPALPSAGFAFAATERMRPWIDILNVMLNALPESATIEIHRRWNGGIPLSLSELPPVYTSLESKWIEEHKHVRVAVAEGNAPVAFFDDSGQLRGMIADILTALRLRTGFIFEIQRYPSQAEAYAAVQNGRSELVAGGSQEGIWQAKLLTTRTWLYNSWVMVGRSNRAPDQPVQNVASLRGDAPEEWLRRQGINQLTRVDTWREGLGRVLRRESDIMIVPLIVANELLAQKAYASLKIIASLDADPLRLSFGASRKAWPLVTILNKALINIPPEDLHALTRSGYSGNSFSSVAEDDSYSLYIGAGAVLFAVAAMVLWLWCSRWRRMMNTMDALPAPMYVCDQRGRLLAGNNALRQTLGISKRQLRGTTLEDWLDQVKPGMRTVERDGRQLRLWRAPVRGKRVSLGGWLDITRQRQRITILQRARRRATDASREKSTFLTTMSHEIRTPLSAVIGMLELVTRRGGDTPENRQSIRIAREAAQSLLELLGNILDVSRIESGRMVLHPKRVALRELIESTAVMFEGLAAKKGLRFELEIDAELNVDVLVDAMRLRQIMANLVANAIKFTDHGDVALRARPQGTDGNRLRLCLEVEDTGEGIEPAVQARLFRPFEQAESRRMAQGSGLGLYISRTLAQMMGGDVTLQSQPGEGTTVSVMINLPVMKPLARAEPDAMAAPIGSGRALDILIVDDNPAGRLLLGQQLTWFGHRVISCSDGQAALDCLAHTTVDAVISDCNMPGISGFALAGMVRERWSELPFIGVTADARESVRDEARAAGMTDCLLKPVTLAMLETWLDHLMADIARRENTATASKSPGMGDEDVSPPCSDTMPVELPRSRTQPVDWNGATDTSALPAALLSGENLSLFLELQITVIDDTLASIAAWRDDATVPLGAALHRLCGGIQLLGAHVLVAHCREQELTPDVDGLRRLERELCVLREALLHWQQTGLQPAQNVLQGNEEDGGS